MRKATTRSAAIILVFNSGMLCIGACGAGGSTTVPDYSTAAADPAATPPIGASPTSGNASDGASTSPGASVAGTGNTAATSAASATLDGVGTSAGVSAVETADPPAAGTTATPPSSVATGTPGFENLAPPLGEPLPAEGKTLTPPPPAGWVYYEIDDSVCRDGSKAGFYLHRGTVGKLLIFLEGGGACMNDHLCAFNQHNVNVAFAGDGQTLISAAIGTVPDRQQPGVFSQIDHQGPPLGIHDLDNPLNPFMGWHQVYVPYCSGDVHAGTRANGSVFGLQNQQFLGYPNMKAFISRLVPTFRTDVDHVVLSGSSAGSIGALFNVSMVSDAFGPDIQVDVIADSGLPLRDTYWPTCLQTRYREIWGLDAALPPDCAGCFNPDGGGLLEGMGTFLKQKHPKLRGAAFSHTEDEVMRLFYSGGLNNCAAFDDLDPVAVVLGNLLDPSVIYPGPEYTKAIFDTRDWVKANSFPLSTYIVAGPNPNFHQTIFRQEFYEVMSGGITPAEFIKRWLEGQDQTIEP